MNSTNRGLNRIILLFVGVVLAGVGAAGVVATVWPFAGEVWQTGLSSATEWMHNANQQTRIWDGATVSWFVVGVLILLVLISAVAVFVILRLGGGRTSIVVWDDSGEGNQGPVTIGSGFVSDAITHSLAKHAEILSSRVNAWRVNGVDVLHVSVTPRQNTSPKVAAYMVAQLVTSLTTLTGRETPTLVSIHSGVRSRMAADQARVN
ncbi:hypothetical protein ACXR2W_09515 [Leucobacter sp. HY1908]